MVTQRPYANMMDVKTSCGRRVVVGDTKSE